MLSAAADRRQTRRQVLGGNVGGNPGTTPIEIVSYCRSMASANFAKRSRDRAERAFGGAQRAVKSPGLTA
jgi:hypothetical protein